MSDILCRCLNEELHLSKAVEPKKRQLKVQNKKRMRNTKKVCHQDSDVRTRIPATTVKIPKPSPYTLRFKLKKKQQLQQRREQEAQTVHTEIAQFETNRKKPVTSGLIFSSSQGCNISGIGTKVILQSNSKYLQEVHQRLQENAIDAQQREKRVDRFLVEQFMSHEAREEARRDEQLVMRLTRQTQQEKRLAAQLLQMRMQKDVIRENRLFREQQYQQRRERDFQEALEREAVR